MRVTEKEISAMKFLRTYCSLFTLKGMKKILNESGIPATLDDTRDFLEGNPNVLALNNSRYITRAGAFSHEIFSILPTAREFEQGVFIPGSRCMPFVDSDRISSLFSFYAGDKKLGRKVAEFDSDDAIDMFLMYGEEYAPQYISADPANADLDMVDRNFELPAKVKLTGIDISYLKQKFGFKKGDRILCCVTDWDAGRINIAVSRTSVNDFDRGEIGEMRLGWYALLEKYLLESFERFGPQATIEDQLTKVMFEHRQKLCVPYCGSVEEYISTYAKKVGLQHYGVETRLWYKDQDVPAFGKWNITEYRAHAKSVSAFPLKDFLLATVPDYVMDEYVADGFFTRSKNIVSDVIDSLCQGEVTLDDEDISALSLNLKGRGDIISPAYNWFSDQVLGPVRHKALSLFGKINMLVTKADYYGAGAETPFQQDLVILSQLYSHLLRMIETIAFDAEAESGAEAFLLSLDGMEWNFEDIEDSVMASIEKARLASFKVVQHF